jgi:hypothetical protein
LLSRTETKTQKQKNLEINSPFLDRKIEETAAGLPPSYAKSLRSNRIKFTEFLLKTRLS